MPASAMWKGRATLFDPRWFGPQKPGVWFVLALYYPRNRISAVQIVHKTPRSHEIRVAYRCPYENRQMLHKYLQYINTDLGSMRPASNGVRLDLWRDNNTLDSRMRAANEIGLAATKVVACLVNMLRAVNFLQKTTSLLMSRKGGMRTQKSRYLHLELRHKTTSV